MPDGRFTVPPVEELNAVVVGVPCGVIVGCTLLI